MMHAVSENEVDEVKRLIRKGCAVGIPDYDGRTPLHVAASNNNYEIVEVILNVKGIQPNPVDNFEMTPFHDAMINKHFKVAELLKKNNGV
jgi:glutaminase